MAFIKALYERKCKSLIGWFEVGETKLLGPNLVQESIARVKLIKERLSMAQSK